ncbi:MAG: nicotinate (nicotinamide) nucleotide adenylyltransferase [Planctomycetota bacterium]
MSDNSFQGKGAECSPRGPDFQDGEGGKASPGDGHGIALLGGVFDPVHLGHLALARATLDALPVERVIFLPAGDPPHKEGCGAPAADRLEMLRLATAGEPRTSIDERELHRQGPSYTVLSLRELASLHPRRPIFLLLGADNVPLIRGWHRAEEILRLATPVVAPRPGHRSRFLPEDLPFLSRERIEELNHRVLPALDAPFSSSEARERIQAGDDVESLVPAAVARYIAEQGLYR